MINLINLTERKYITHKQIKTVVKNNVITVSGVPRQESTGILWNYDFEDGCEYILRVDVVSRNGSKYFLFCENNAGDRLIERKYVFITSVNIDVSIKGKKGNYYVGILTWDRGIIYDFDVKMMGIEKCTKEKETKVSVVPKALPLPLQISKKYIGKQSVSSIIEATIDMEQRTNLTAGVSFLIRAKNESDNMSDCIETLVASKYAHEIIFVDNGSTDDTYAIAKKYEAMYPQIFVYKYNIAIPKVGIEHEKAVENNDKNTLGTYYNWCLSKVTKYNVIKWDADFVTIPNNLDSMIEQYNIHTRDDKFSVWFSGMAMYYGKYIRYQSWYDEFRVFSKKSGFEWANYKGCETSAYYVWDCRKCYINGSSDVFSDVRSSDVAKKIAEHKKDSPAVFIEKKNMSDYKMGTNLLDTRDNVDNNYLIKYVNDRAYDGLRKTTISSDSVLIAIPGLGVGGGNYWFINLYRTLRKFGIKVYLYANNSGDRFYENATPILDPKMTSSDLTQFIIKNGIKHVIQSIPKLLPEDLASLQDKTNNYVLTHSDVSYINRYIVDNHKYFKGIISVNGHTIHKFLPLLRTTASNVNILKNYIIHEPVQQTKIIPTNGIYNIGIISRLSADKNIILLLYAIKNIPNAILHIIGDDTPNMMKTILFYISLLNLTNRVNIYGLQKDTDTYYKMIDICVLPSVSEGMSYNLMECILYNIPVVATKIPANEELLGSSASYFEIDSNVPLQNEQITINNYNEFIENVGLYTYQPDIEIKTPELMPTTAHDHIKKKARFELHTRRLTNAIVDIMDNCNAYRQKTREWYIERKDDYFSEERYINDLFKILSINESFEVI